MPFNTGHALLIGVGSYQHVPRLDVPATTIDAQELATVIQDARYCGYPAEQVTLLTEGHATRDGILGALDTLAQRAGEDDTVLLFYSGHGDFGEDEAYYLTTFDMRKTEARTVVAGSAVKEAELLEKLRAIPAKRVILLFNACHSGEISPVLADTAETDLAEGARSLPYDVAAAVLATGEGRVIITACREQQFSFVGSGERTIFGQALIDGLQGRGTHSNKGYISTFDLYTYVYYAVGDAVQKIPLKVRQRYAGGVQEPELTVLKGVGPMPVALYKGAPATLGDFDAAEALDEETAVRQVERKFSERKLHSFIAISAGRDLTIDRRAMTQTIGDNARVGTAVAGDVHGNISHTEQSGGVNLGSGNTIGSIGEITGGDKIAGDKVGGDKVDGDKITTGNITGSSGIAIGRGASAIDARGAQGFVNQPSGPVNQHFGEQRTIDTGGGDYVEGAADKRGGSFVQGDQTTISGVSGSNINIGSTLTNVAQRIEQLPHGDAATRAELQRLIAELQATLEQAPPTSRASADEVARRAEAAVAEIARPAPDQEDVQYNLARLQKAAQNLTAVLPAVLPIATRIAERIGKLIAGS